MLPGMDLQRAHCTFEIKSVDSESRVIEGIASTPSLDLQGDEMDPAGAQYRLPIPLFWMHKHDSPIGNVTAAHVGPDGIRVRAQIAPAGLDAVIDRAWNLIKAKLARGFSIDWKPIDQPTFKNGAARYAKWHLLGLSVVTIPANQSASITAIKSLDREAFALSGTARPVPSTSAVAGSSRVTNMNVSEQLTAEKAALQIKSARFAELMTAQEANGGLEDGEATELQTLSKEVPSLTAKVQNLTALEAAQASMTTPVVPSSGMKQGTSVSAPRIEIVKKEFPKGTVFTRYAMAVAAGKGSMADTMAYAKRWSDTPEVVALVKATEGVATLNSPSWGSQLVNADTAMTEFVDLLRAQTIVGRVPGFRNVPFNIPIITQTGGSTFAWVGEGGVKPVGELAFDRTTLTFSKVAGIIVLSEELVRLSSPSAESAVRNDLVEQGARFIDEQFIQISVGPTANSPASITNDVTPTGASGSDMTALLADLNTAIAQFDTANIPTNGLVIVMTPALARGISTLTTPLGTFAFPSMTPDGGTLLGYTVIVSNSVDSGSIVIFKPSEIFLADDGRMTLDASNQATLDMSGGSPTAPTFNLWQRNCVGIRAERWIRWAVRRDGVVAVINSASYGPSVGSP